MKTSAGLLVFRVRKKNLEVFIAHMGGAAVGQQGQARLVDPQG